ncbi:MAG: uroporphyrinogen-III synthase [Methanophagales archaeon]|nr:uroporphyrinogen-III synthase [Methanophagales archaeon]
MKPRIAAFRPENLLSHARELAEQHGFDFFGFPVFDLVARNEALSEIEAAFNEGVDILVFTSVNGIKKSFELCEGKIDLKKSLLEANVELCAIGPVTREELEKRGLRVNLMPSAFSTKGLEELFNAIRVKDRRIVFLRSSEGNKEIISFLERKRAVVTDITVYEMKKKDLTEFKKLFEDLVKFKPDYIIFTSSLTFEIFFELSKELKREKEIFRATKIAAIGDLTAETITGKGMRVDLVAEKSTFEDILNEIKKHAQQEREDRKS